MGETPYSRFAKDDLILRDELSVDRTLLANERTLLAYLRSAVALLIAGASIMHFSQHVWFLVVGIICIPTAAFTGMVGVLRFRKMNRRIAMVRTQNASKPAGTSEPGP